MFDCLIENAVKFTVLGDRIELGGYRAGGEVVLTIADTGEGIPAIDLPHVFDRFRSGSTAGERGGAGLGLAIARAVAEARGGRISVHSSPGHGTTFTTRLPDILRVPTPFTGDLFAPPATPAMNDVTSRRVV
jgi:signal transduction histidine kinase